MYQQWWQDSSDPPAPSRTLLDRTVLVLFVTLAGPITFLQLVSLDLSVLSVVAIPGYLVLLGLSGLLNTIGIEGVVGTPAFYALNVVWTYLFALALVLAGRSLQKTVQE